VNGPLDDVAALTKDALSLFTATANVDGHIQVLLGMPDWDTEAMLKRGFLIDAKNQQSCVGMKMVLGSLEVGGSCPYQKVVNDAGRYPTANELFSNYPPSHPQPCNGTEPFTGPEGTCKEGWVQKKWAA